MAFVVTRVNVHYKRNGYCHKNSSVFDRAPMQGGGDEEQVHQRNRACVPIVGHDGITSRQHGASTLRARGLNLPAFFTVQVEARAQEWFV